MLLSIVSSNVFALTRPLEDIVTFFPEPVVKRELEKLKLSSSIARSSPAI